MEDKQIVKKLPSFLVLFVIMLMLQPGPAVSAEASADAAPALDDAYLKAMQMDEDDELEDEGDAAVSDKLNAEKAKGDQAPPVDPADALKKKIDDIVDWAPEEDLDCD